MKAKLDFFQPKSNFREMWREFYACPPITASLNTIIWREASSKQKCLLEMVNEDKEENEEKKYMKGKRKRQKKENSKL